MKKIFTFFIFLFSFSTLFAQILYTRKDTILITQDSITLKAGEFRGAIQWQYSADKKIWNNLNGKVKERLKLIKSAKGYYRAEIIDHNCTPVYSDTAQIKIEFSISKTITAQSGGSITTPDNSTLIIPVNALQTDGKVTISTVEANEQPITTNPNLQDFGNSYKLEIPGNILLHSLTLTFVLDSLPSPIENYILCLYNGSSYFPIEYTISGNTVTAIIDNINWETTESLKNANLFSQLIISGFKAKQTPPTAEMGLKEANLSGEALTFSNPVAVCDGEKVLLLIHGWIDKPQTWKNFVKNISSQTEIKFDKIWTFGYNSSYSIDRNALELSQVLTNYTNGTKVKIVAHSMGGLVSRSMMELYGGSKYVKRLVTLGTPHQGSPLGALRNVIGNFVKFGQPDSYLQDYNMNTQGFRDLQDNSIFIQILKKLDQPPIPYYTIAAIGDGSFVGSRFINGSDDGVVSVTSALGVPNTTGNATITIAAGLAHNEMLSDFNVFNKAKEFLVDNYTLKVVQGDKQDGKPSEKLPLPIIVQVLDEFNEPVKNEYVYFDTDFGSVDPSVAHTDDEGKVSVFWTLGAGAGDHLLNAFMKNENQEIINSTKISITVKICGCDKSKLGSFTDTRDGRTYQTITIGTQTWMAQELRYSINNCSFLYDFSTAQIACPAGWHLPSESEWNTLIGNLGGNLVAGNKMIINLNCGGTSESCFNAVSFGYTWTWGKLQVMDMGSCWWSSSGVAIELNHVSGIIKTVDRIKSDEFGIRCIKD